MMKCTGDHKRNRDLRPLNCAPKVEWPGKRIDRNTLTAPSASSLARRWKELYDNFPLPLPIVAAMALDLLLDRLRPVPLPGS